MERERCTGCTACAQACMCGAIEYLVIPPDTRRHRKKKDEVLPPLPVWTTIHSPVPEPGLRGVRWQRVVFAVVMVSVFIFIVATQVGAGIRKMDPDGCLSCHGLKGLEFTDDQGVLRSSYIDEAQYYASLHGSVPCTDCHRKIKEYPHRVEDGAVDCAESCHIKEPSREERYSHKKLVEEFKRSAHKDGSVKGFSGGNRMKEVSEGESPSCRWCHSNTPSLL